MDVGLDIQDKVINSCIELRVRAQTVVIRYLQAFVDTSVPFSDYEEQLTNLTVKAGVHIQQIQNAKEADIKAIASEWVISNQGWEDKYNSNFNEILTTAKEAVARLQAREAELEAARQELNESLKPHLLPGQTEQSRIANAIAQYYFNLGYTLDTLDWESTETGYKLTFSSSRNGQRFITSEMLNDKEAGLPEKLKELTNSLNTPKFERSERGGHWILEIQKWYPQKKKINEVDINKLWTPASKFESLVSGWSRIRITGGSESGKSPTAENIAVCILKARPGIAKLCNPQHDSVKNYWTLPTIAISHKESEKVIAELAKLVDARANGLQQRNSFELYVFDEIDSTMSHTKGKKFEIGGNVNFIIKQASHQNLGAIFIGQNANVSEYPGMDRSDWNSAVNLHIGSNAYDAITNSNLFTNELKEKLKSTADKLSEYCETKNNELAFDKTDPNAYRYAFVVEPNKKPYFIELPPFGTYTYVQNIQNISGITQSASDASNLHPTHPTDATQASNPDSSVAFEVASSGYVGVGCQKCKNGVFNKVKTNRGVKCYCCGNCGKWTSENVLKGQNQY